MRKLLRLLTICASVIAPLAGPATARASREYQVKAVFLYNFARFVDWPDSAFPGTDGPLTIGLLGEDPFDGFLDSAVKGESKGARPIAVKRVDNAEEAKGCQILFIGRAQGAAVEALLARLKDKPILTVGETEPFFRAGGMIRFYMDKTRIRLRIHLDEVQAAKLTISAKLLRLADLAPSGKG